MKKITKKIISLVLATLTCFSLVGCERDRSGDTPEADETKSVLTVYCIEGGVGTTWIYDVEKKFEEAYADVEFEPGSGKKGVDIVISTGRDAMVNNIKQQSHNVVFTEAVPVFTLANSGDLLPITDIVTSSLGDVTGGAENVTIESKLSDSYKTSLKAINNEYYMLPHFESYSGMFYNVKVFRENELYFKDGGGFTGDKSLGTVGPDGVKDTYDDGMASSVEEFLSLMDRMVAKDVVPFIWTSGYATYITRFLSAMDASLSGYDGYMLNYNYGKDGVVSSGSTNIITGFDGVTPQISKVDITPEKGYLMSQRASSYYALKLLEKIQSDSKYYSDKMTETLSHTQAQGQFIYSDLQDEPIAILAAEGSYWFNEASDYLKRVENLYKVNSKDLEYEMMPLPVQVSGSVKAGELHTQTLVSTNNSFAFINGNISNDANKVALAKLFLKYCYTNKSLVDFFMETGVFKGVDTDLTGVNLDGMDYYKKSVAELRQNAKVATTISDNALTIRGLVSAFDSWGSICTVKGQKVDYSLPSDAFKSKAVTAEDYFKGMWITENTWNTKYGSIFNK